MKVQLSIHAQDQLQARGIASESEVLQAVDRVASKILKVNDFEVKVIIKRFESKVTCSDGSNGDVVLACVDTRTLKVKTVMLQRSSQIERKARYEVYM